jgi:hypothetical protein
MLQRLQPRNQPLSSDIDRYFDSPRLEVTDTEGPNWLFNWWRVHRDEYPKMAAAARDYLAIPASEVSVERKFNSGREFTRDPEIFDKVRYYENVNVDG